MPHPDPDIIITAFITGTGFEMKDEFFDRYAG
jgi:hypothetical protein